MQAGEAINGRCGYVLEEGADGPTLVVTASWTRGVADAIANIEPEGLTLNYARGFAAPDLEFLDPSWGLRRLDVLDRSIDDLSPIDRLGETLEHLSVQASPTATVDLAALPHLRSLGAAWPAIRESFHSLDGLERLVTWEFDQEDLTSFESNVQLQELTLKGAPRLQSLEGASTLALLSTLRVALARELTDISELGALTRSLRELEFETCLGIERIEDVRPLTGLRVLGVNDCGRIESLRPLAAVQELEVFDAWESTRILDNDLSPLTRLPRLREVRMRARREYRPSLAEVVAQLSHAP